MAGSKLLKKSSRPDYGHDSQHRLLTRSPSLSPIPQQAEPKPRTANEPYPIPSSNPASQYTLLEKLGTGSFGTVYKAMHNETKQIVAIKQIGMSESIVSSYSRLPLLLLILRRRFTHLHYTLLTQALPLHFLSLTPSSHRYPYPALSQSQSHIHTYTSRKCTKLPPISLRLSNSQTL